MVALLMIDNDNGSSMGMVIFGIGICNTSGSGGGEAV